MRLLILLACLMPAWAFAQNLIKGEVQDESGMPLSEVVVRIAGSQLMTLSDESGAFLFEKMKNGSYKLHFSHLGYEPLIAELDVSSDVEYPATMKKMSVIADEVIVKATRNNSSGPAPHVRISQEHLEQVNLGQDLPIQLKYSPSLVTTSDAGAGVGYTGLRIRGTDQSRINVTINGVPLNDSESQGVFYVNLPDLSSSVEDVEIQRGLGSSVSGTGSFGGAVNIKTTNLNRKAYGEVNAAYGSFNTLKTTLKFGSGLINDRFVFDGRLSKVSSDGYIDRATSDLKSLFVSAGYYHKNTMLRFNAFTGKEITYQAWYGVPESALDTNRTMNVAGTDFGGRAEPYDNEVDNYQQDHYQLNFVQKIGEHFNLNSTVHLTHGRGYFEQYKVGQSLANYGINPFITQNDTLFDSDLIRRRWLDNYFYGFNANIEYNRDNRLSAMLGGALSRYIGDHFGRVVWARNAGDSEIRHRYYDGTGDKYDWNVFGKLTYTPLSKLKLFADLQLRRVDYMVDGTDNDGISLDVDVDHLFFNPKIGATFNPSRAHVINLWFGVGHKEPSREDYVSAPDDKSPKAEQLRDLELGYTYKSGANRFGLNLYFMNYKDQLILTGELNDVGTPLRENVAKSYRAGVELFANWSITNQLRIDADLTYSVNKISEISQYFSTYNDFYSPVDSLIVKQTFESTDIAFSPSLIASAVLGYEPVKGLHIQLTGKYVGEQFLDNSSSDQKKIDDYLTNDLRISYRFSLKRVKEIALRFNVYNLTNRKYVSNGYTWTERYAYADGSGAQQVTEPVVYNYFYPQAGTHFMAGLGLKF